MSPHTFAGKARERAQAETSPLELAYPERGKKRPKLASVE
jgi:hypothetical protein